MRSVTTPGLGQVFYIPDPSRPDWVRQWRWWGLSWQMLLLSRGFVHLDFASARRHGEAISREPSP